MTTITPEEREQWKSEAFRYHTAKSSTDYKITQLCRDIENREARENSLRNRLEAAEARAEAAERELYWLAKNLASTDRLLWPDSRFERKNPAFWLEAAKQQAAGRE